jgi:hypothetical protein
MYVTLDDELPRRLDEGGVQITDYNLKEFKKTDLADSVFAVPNYCNVAKPTRCPSTSFCGQIKQGKRNILLNDQI